MARHSPARGRTPRLCRVGVPRGGGARPADGVRPGEPRRPDRSLVGLRPRQAGSRVAGDQRTSRHLAGPQLHQGARPARAGVPGGGAGGRGAGPPGRLPGPAAAWRPPPRDRDRDRPVRLLPHPRPRGAAHPGGAGGERRPAAGRGRRVAGAGVPAPRVDAVAPAARAPRCSARSTRWYGTATGRSGCSGSSTASRSTRRRRSGSTATTRCRSCSTAPWWAGSTSRRIARGPGCWCRELTPRTASTSGTWPVGCAPSWRRWLDGSPSVRSRWRPTGTWPVRSALPSNRRAESIRSRGTEFDPGAKGTLVTDPRDQSRRTRSPVSSSWAAR